MNTKELAELHGFSESTVRKKTKSAKDNGANYILIDKRRYVFEEISSNRGKSYEYKDFEEVKKESKRLTNGDELKKSGFKLDRLTLSDKQKKQISQRVKILKEWEGYKKKSLGMREFLEYCKMAYPDEKCSKQKIYRWQSEYKRDGVMALADRRGYVREGKSALKEWMREFVLQNFRAYGAGSINYRQLWRELHKEADRRGEFDFYKFLSKEVKPLCGSETIKRFIDNYFKKRAVELSLIINGGDRTKSYLQPAMGDQGEMVTRKNQVWQIDSSPLDAMVILDGKIVRADLICIVDVYSGRCVIDMAVKSNSLAIIRLLWKALEWFGKPELIKGDNGKDYLSKNFQNLLDGLNIKYDRAIAYSGDQKGFVERKFRTIQHSHIAFTTSYIGNSVALREKIEHRKPKSERKGVGATNIDKELLFSWEQMEAVVEDSVYLWDIDRVSRADGVSPIDKWNECDELIERVDYTQFLINAGGYSERTVQKYGIAYDNRKFEADWMWKYPKQKVFVSENIDNIQELFVFDEEGLFLGIAFDREAKKMMVDDYKNLVKAFNKDVREKQKLFKEASYSTKTKESIKDDLLKTKTAHSNSIKDIGEKKSVNNPDIEEKMKRDRVEGVANLNLNIEVDSKKQSYNKYMLEFAKDVLKEASA